MSGRDLGCLCYCKDTKLKAIHNKKMIVNKKQFVVYATAKILNWKQFTTLKIKRVDKYCCLCYCKDTKLKAIHNSKSLQMLRSYVVYATAKILNWKQFTTA